MKVETKENKQYYNEGVKVSLQYVEKTVHQ